MLSRIDLADLSDDPEILAAAVHRLVGRFEDAVPIADLALALDIVKVDLRETDGFEGMLLTDAARGWGGIIANTGRGDRRARFTVAHELGHFLMERHQPTTEQGFACRSADLREARRGTRHQRQETEANRFAISVLAPPYLVAPHLKADPDLRGISALARALDISREAAGRRYVELSNESLALVWTHHGLVRYAVRGERFPWIARGRGDRLATTTPASRAIAAGKSGITNLVETTSAAWVQGADIDLFEQTRVGQGGHAATLLWADWSELDAQDDAEDDGPSELGEPTFKPRRR